MIKNITKGTLKELRHPITVMVILFGILISLSSCGNEKALLGGSITVEVEKDQKLMNCSWKKDASLWILTRARKEGEVPETYKYVEKSNLGVFEGSVTIIEK